MEKQIFKICIVTFLTAILLCPSFGMLNISTKIIGNARADYVDANNNTNCIEEDPLVPGWSKDVRLTNDSADSLHPSIAVDSDDTIYIVWEDACDVWQGGYWGIYFTKSNDDGETWVTPKRINTPSNDGHTPHIIVDQNDTIHLVWSGASIEENYYEIYYKNSTDGGNTWNEDVRLTYASDDSFTPKIVAYGNILHVVWSDKRDGNFEIYYKRSTDMGNTWEEDIQLTTSSGTAGAPTLAVDLIGSIHIVWQDTRGGNYSVYYQFISNNGNLSEDAWLVKTSDKTTGNYPNPIIAVDSYSNIYVTWADYTSKTVWADIFLKKSPDGGKTWEEAIRMTENPSTDSYMPSMVIAPNSVLYLFWKCSNFSYLEDGWYRTGNDLYYIGMSMGNDIYKRNSNENSVRLTHAVNNTRMYPKVAIDHKGVLHIVWFDDRSNNKEIYYKRTLNPATQPPIIVTSSLNLTTCKPNNSVTVSGNTIYDDTPVQNAIVTIKILETNEEYLTSTDYDGNYEMEITAPGTPGDYTVRVKVVWGNHTGWKQMTLKVEQEATNGSTTNGGQQPGDGDKLGSDFNYVVMIVAIIAMCIIVGVVLVKRRGKTSAKTEKEKTEKTTMGLRCPKCKKTFRVELKPKPFSVKCPFCGKEGVIK